MAVSTRCFLNLFHPLPPSTFQVSSTPDIACPPTSAKERSWRTKCVLGLTCAMIGFELDNFVIIGDENRANAGEMVQQLQSGSGVRRWSDQRSCLPWRVNSLETIVPENLPRPSGRRRWEAVEFDKAAPPVKMAAKSAAKGCFYL